MINLRLHDAGDLTVALRAAPDLPLRPHRQLAQFMHRRMIISPDLVRKRQVRWIEYSGFCSEEAHEACGLLDDETRIGALPQRSIEQQDPRGMLRPGSKAARGPLQRVARIERRQEVGFGQSSKSHTRSAVDEGVRTRRAASAASPSTVDRSSAEVPKRSIRTANRNGAPACPKRAGTIRMPWRRQIGRASCRERV